MKVFLIGATGVLGSSLARLLSSRGDHVTGMHRVNDLAHAVHATGATPLQGDPLTDSMTDLAAKMIGHDAVLFCAEAHGPGEARTTLFDERSLEKAAQAAALSGTNRFLLVTAALGSGGFVSEGLQHCLAVSQQSQKCLIRTGLEWLIVRSETSTQELGTGNVTAALTASPGELYLDNLTAFIAEALHEHALRRMVVELLDGQIPISDAVVALTQS